MSRSERGCLTASSLFRGLCQNSPTWCTHRWKPRSGAATFASLPRTLRRKYTESEDDVIVKGQSEGKAWKDIAARLDRPVSGVRSRFNDYLFERGSTVARRSRGERKFTESEDQAIIKGRTASKTWELISKETSRSVGMLKNRYYTILAPRVFGPINPQRRFTLSEDQLLLELRSEGLSWRAIASRLSRSIASVTRRYTGYLAYQPCQGPALSAKEAPCTRSELDNILRLRDNHDLSFREIAARTRRTPDLVRFQYFRERPKQAPRRSGVYWTETEDQHLLRGRSKPGWTWQEIADSLPGRSRAAAKGRYELLRSMKVVEPK